MKKIIDVSIGIVIGVAITLIAMLLLSFVMLSLNIDREFASPFATVSVSLGAFVSSMYSARKIGDRGYLVGLAVGLAVFAIIAIISVIVNPGGLTYNSLFHLIIITISSVIGGILGVNIGKNKKFI